MAARQKRRPETPDCVASSEDLEATRDQTTTTSNFKKSSIAIVVKDAVKKNADDDMESAGGDEYSKAEGSITPTKRKHEEDIESRPNLSRTERKLLKKKNKEFSRKSEGNGKPCFMLSRNYDRLNIRDVRDLILFLLTETKTLPWIMVKNKFNIHKVVLLHVPGLDPHLFNIKLQHPDSDKPVAWAEKATKGPVTEFQHLKAFFDVMNVMRVGGDKSRIFSPVETLLYVPMSNSEKAKKEAEKRSKKKSASTLKPESYMLTLDDLKEGDFPLPSYLTPNTALQEDWVETRQQAGTTIPKKMITMDCEMVLTTAGSEVTRISLVDENRTTIFDELVMPDNRIVDYLTQYSGMTAERLEGVSTKLADAQARLQKLITYDTILIGHSLENDLKVLKFAHPFIIDTTVIYHHVRGPPFRPSLKWLAHKWLSRTIQNGGNAGHDSVEDACACMDLVKLKIREGPGFGEYNQESQSIFTRLSRHSAPRLSVAIDSEAVPGETCAATVIKVKTDAEVVKAVSGAIEEYNFVWARLQAMEINHEKTRPPRWTGGPEDKDEAENADGEVSQVLDSTTCMSSRTISEDETKAIDDEIRKAVRSIDNSIAGIVESLPTNTALIITSGGGDIREVQRLQARQKKFNKLYNTVGLSSIPMEDQFLDEDQQLLHKAVDRAKNGVCFFMVK